ncbi:bacteriophage abortive infection AbiH family protein [Gorillibacterium timonense]|uniref:bacteriophage abortive infection AbiH family protein n=1 Tax=Gorillibacterium timonense TaxID=1689269 RepID=UPI00071CAF0E|nr:bacteriophage abortive infection AbiH family protein [Gorillibacterium timonense]
MNSLFLIGNGFDLAHGMKTSYENFHDYLKENHPDAKASFGGYVPESITMPDGGESYNDVEVVGLLFEVISNAEPYGDKWSDLETSVGYLELDDYFSDWDEDDDDNPWHKVYRNQDLADNLVGAILEITEYFADWINEIEPTDSLPIADFVKLIDKKNDFFLTFNYTDTLEMLYEAENVCHIHGEQGGELLFGHGNDEDYYEENMGRNVGSEDRLQYMQSKLRKNTEMALKKNQGFFRSISKSVKKIYSYGFSFSKVDEVYVHELCRILPTADITWYLNDYDDVSKQDEYKEVVRSCGFKGSFDTYHIS